MTGVSMTEVERITDQIRRGHDGDAWHGPAVRDVIGGIDAAGAASHPIPGVHSIWEIVLHMTAWTAEVARRVGGAHPAMPVEGDWPPVPPAAPEAWADALAGLARAHHDLARALAGLADDRLDAVVGTSRDAPLGSGVSLYAMLHGLVQHDAYHSGQIALLKKALRSRHPGAS
jgi:hypothetical protein